MKNIHVFATELPELPIIEQKIIEAEGVLFAPLLENQAAKFGFNAQETLVKLSNGYKINFVYSWKKLPVSAIREEAERRVEATIEDHTEFVGDEEAIKELTENMAESVLAEYCAKVLPETVYFSAYYHTKHEKFIIDAKEDFAKHAIGMLCQLLGSLETTTLHCSGISNSLTTNMLECLNQKDEFSDVVVEFAGFKAGDLLVLSNKNKDIARFKGDYPIDQVRELLNNGYQVKQINLSKDDVSFTLTEKFKIKQICSTFEIEDPEQEDAFDYALHHQAVELELIVNHCNTLKAFFDQSEESIGNDNPPQDNVKKLSTPVAESSNDNGVDILHEQAVAFVTKHQRVSISSIQRQFRIGYNRSARIVKDMQNLGFVSAPGEDGSRKVLIAA